MHRLCLLIMVQEPGVELTWSFLLRRLSHPALVMMLTSIARCYRQSCMACMPLDAVPMHGVAHPDSDVAPIHDASHRAPARGADPIDRTADAPQSDPPSPPHRLVPLVDELMPESPTASASAQDLSDSAVSTPSSAESPPPYSPTASPSPAPHPPVFFGPITR
jgi:hypothetical protein